MSIVSPDAHRDASARYSIYSQSGKQLVYVTNSGDLVLKQWAGLYGFAKVVAATKQKPETAADANVLTYPPAATAGSYKLYFAMSVSAATSATLGWTATWKDSNGNTQSPTNLSLFQAGTAAPALTFTTSAAGNYYAVMPIDTDNSATNVVVKLTFSGTSFAAKVSAWIEQVQ